MKILDSLFDEINKEEEKPTINKKDKKEKKNKSNTNINIKPSLVDSGSTSKKR